MEVINKIAPSEQQARRFTEPGHDRPIYMLNLLGSFGRKLLFSA